MYIIYDRCHIVITYMQVRSSEQIWTCCLCCVACSVIICKMISVAQVFDFSISQMDEIPDSETQIGHFRLSIRQLSRC